MPYLGTVTLNAGPPSGQPFAGDPYITGPDWGTYGYCAERYDYHLESAAPSWFQSLAPVHRRRHRRAQPVPRFHFQFQFTTFLGPNLSKSLTNVTVECSGFTPQLQATL